MDGVSKGQQRALTVAGVIVGLVAAFFAFNFVIDDQMVEAGRFVLAVFVAGAAFFFFYVMIHDGGAAVLRKQAKPKSPAPVGEAEPVVVTPVVEEDEEDEDAPPQRPLRARERPLRPPNRG